MTRIVVFRGALVLVYLASFCLIALTMHAFANSLDDNAHKQALKEANVRFTYEYEKCGDVPAVKRDQCRAVVKMQHTKAIEAADKLKKVSK